MSTKDESPKTDTNEQPASNSRRDALKSMGAVAAGMAAAATPPALAADAKSGPPGVKNPYGGGPGTGISLPPYFRPTEGVKNNNVYYPGTEELGKDEMRISFVGSCPSAWSTIFS